MSDPAQVFQAMAGTTPPPAPGAVAVASPAAGAVTFADSPAIKAPQKYPSYRDYETDELARVINDVLDSLDMAPPGAKIHDPATKFKVGQSARATWEVYAHKAGEIHPGTWLLLSLLAYAAIVAMHWFSAQKAKAAPQAAEQESAKPEVNRFARDS